MTFRASLRAFADRVHDSTVTATADGAPGTGTHDGSEVARLLAAARNVLSRSGWWGFKVESVLREARLSTRSFYRHYDGKNDLLMDLFEEEVDGIVRRLERLAASDPQPDGRLAAWIDGILAMAFEERHAGPASMFAQHWRLLLETYPDRMQRIVERLVGTLTPVLRDGAELGVWPQARPDVDAYCVFYVAASVAADLAACPGELSRAEATDRVLPFVRRALGG